MVCPLLLKFGLMEKASNRFAIRYSLSIVKVGLVLKLFDIPCCLIMDQLNMNECHYRLIAISSGVSVRKRTNPLGCLGHFE
jgi:hypothetical protein